MESVRFVVRRRRRIAIAGIAFAMSLTTTACSAGVTIDEPGPVPAPEPVPALPDGEVFALITVGSDESGETTLGVDVAEMLTGDEAREAAVEDGLISEGEDLPNDFYIDNDDVTYELLHFSDDPTITVISGSDTSHNVEIEVEHLVQLWNGEYAGEPIYGIVPSVPIPMEVTVAGGVVTAAIMVYLP